MRYLVILLLFMGCGENVRNTFSVYQINECSKLGKTLGYETTVTSNGFCGLRKEDWTFNFAPNELEGANHALEVRDTIIRSPQIKACAKKCNFKCKEERINRLWKCDDAGKGETK